MPVARRLPALLLGAVACVLASGCSSTLVQYLPAGDKTTCDASWPGLWRATNGDGKKPEAAWLEVNADCTRYTITDDEKTADEDMVLTKVTTGSGDFLWVGKRDGAPECLGEGGRDCGLPIMRYVQDGDEIRLYGANHQVVHDAIAHGLITGVTPDALMPPVPSPKPGERATAVSVVNNLITGTPEQIAQILADHPEFFDDKPWLVAHRETTDTRPKHPAKKP